jgi:hypothetical protein
LLACARTRLDDAHRERIRGLLRNPIDWTLFLSEVSRHGLGPLADQHLNTADEWVIPAAAAASLDVLAQSKSLHSLLYAGRLVELLNLFKSAGVTAIPYKGPTLGAMAYGSLALRSFADLDFILPQRDLLPAAQLLIDRGYRAYPDPTDSEEARVLARFHPGQYAFVCDSRPPQVELHTENTLRYMPVPLDWDGLMRRSITVSLGGREVRTFSVEDTLVLLCVHGTKHFWERLSWICDIAELTQSKGGVDWELAQDLAQRAGCRRMWMLGLSLACQLLDAPLPPKVEDWIAADSRVNWLMEQTQSRLTGEDHTIRGLPNRLFFRLASHENLAVALRQCIRTAMYPTETDWKAYPLPDYAAPLYLAVRPWRLLCEHGFGLRPKGLPDPDGDVPYLQQNVVNKAGSA